MKKSAFKERVFAPVGKQELPTCLRASACACSHADRYTHRQTGQVGLARKKVFVGLSGGVDSAVSAALLKEAGYDVTGVFIKVWQPPFLACTSREDREDAMRVAAHLDNPFTTHDLSKEYKKEVVDYMLAEYKKGNTPNPDAMCNKEIKFGAFLSWALRRGADYVATGHYAIKQQITNNKQQITHYELHTSRDKEKDQSYFLWTLTQRQLRHILFPVGNYEKKREVRALARRFGLPTAEKKDSQGLCFVGKVDMKEFLSNLLGPKKGKLLDEKGSVIGTHDGALLYTLGERHGFAVAQKSPSDQPRYVIRKDIKRNTVTVSAAPKTRARAGALVSAGQANFISERPKKGDACRARFRYRQTPVPCEVRAVAPRAISLRLKTPDYTVSRGQSLVLYAGDKCLGGGVIA
ncbi:MAG: tRNA 2-thiouridine(34) synthase MnmA [bacterium]|nr:tRNA 2-thiouridine(34) synthase MnmA [bacterium]